MTQKFRIVGKYNYLPALVSVILLFANVMISQAQTLKESMARGQEIYGNECMVCHMENGQGLSGAFPPLASSDYFADDVSKAIDAIVNGLEGELTVNDNTYFGVMDPVELSDQEIADVLNYIRNSWGSASSAISSEEVASIKQNL
ncbi:MAG: cytochrome c [Reichenbachiella sp.]|uniref:c-type cytochrome n=1 Tax=Reichenbachiella sp. TaxID=2184521 RepID=UPI003267C501